MSEIYRPRSPEQSAIESQKLLRANVKKYFHENDWGKRVLNTMHSRTKPISVDNMGQDLHRMAATFAKDFCKQFPAARNLTPGSGLCYGSIYSDSAVQAVTISDKERTLYNKLTGSIPIRYWRYEGNPIQTSKNSGRATEEHESIYNIAELYPAWVADAFLDLVGQIKYETKSS